jgi:hypothetical protein
VKKNVRAKVKDQALGIGIVAALAILSIGGGIVIGGIPVGAIVLNIVFWLVVAASVLISRWRISREVRRRYRHCICVRGEPPKLTCPIHCREAEVWGQSCYPHQPAINLFDDVPSGPLPDTEASIDKRE